MSNTLEDFLKYTDSQKEVSLVIANDDIELLKFSKKLVLNNFQQIQNTFDLLNKVIKPSKSFFIVKKILSQDAFDIIVQYPFGAIRVEDKSSSKVYQVTPIFDNVSIVILMTEQSLNKTQKSGYALLNRVGLIYRSNNNGI